MRCLYRNINATSNEEPPTMRNDVASGDAHERRAIGHFEYAVFPTNRFADE
jgi:hypothetical protein